MCLDEIFEFYLTHPPISYPPPQGCRVEVGRGMFFDSLFLLVRRGMRGYGGRMGHLHTHHINKVYIMSECIEVYEGFRTSV